TPDPKQTLVGTGGMDPNPDFGPHSQNTVPHQASQSTMVNMRPAAPPPPRQYQRPAMQAPPPPGRAQQPALPLRPRRRRAVLGVPAGCLMLVIGLMATFCGGLTILTLATSAIFGARIENQLSQRVAAVDDYQNFESTFYYDRNGVELYEAFNEGRRTNISIQNI